MDDDQRLAAMMEKRHQLEDAIRDIDYEVEHAEHAAVHAEEPGRLVAYIGERYRAQQAHFYDLGKLNARIEDLEQRSRERTLSVEERATAGDWDQATTPTDHIDWLRPSLDEAAAARELADAERTYDRAEERLLDEMHSETPEHEDHLDWFRPR